MSPSITASDPPASAATPVSLEHAIEHFLSDLPAETAHRIRLASGIDTPTLRAAYRESRQVPALLLDTRQRFELEQEILDFIDALGQGSPSASEATTLSWQLQLLGLELLWPTTSVLQVYDPPGYSAAAEYGPDLSPNLPRVRINRARVLDGSLWRSVLQWLSPEQSESLLGGQYPTLDSQLSALQQKAALVLSSQRRGLFDSLHAFRQQSRDPLVNLLRSRIPGLSRAAAQELLANSNAHDLQSLALSEGEPSEGQALDARWYLQEDRLSRAYEGLFLESRQHNDDTQRLLRHSLATLPDTQRNHLDLNDHQAIQRLLHQHPPLSRAHLGALLGLSPVEPTQRLSDGNGYQQDPTARFATPDPLAQRQRDAFDALAATNERTLLLARQQPNFHWFAGLLLSRQLAHDFPLAASKDPDAIFLNTFEESLYWPLSDSGERGEQVRYRGVTQSRTLTEIFTQHLAGNIQAFDPATSGFYASATAAYDEQQLAGLDLARFGKTLENATLGFDTRFSEQVDGFWASAAPLLRENLRTQIRLEAQLRELDLGLDKSLRADLERILEHPTHAQRQKKFPGEGPIHVYRIALQPSELVLEGCLVITRSPDEDTYKLPALLYQIGRGLEPFASLQALKKSLTERLDDAVERESLLDLLPQRLRTWSPESAPERTSLFSYRLEQGDPFQQLVDGLLAKQKDDFAATWRFAKGAPGLYNDVGEFARQLDGAVSLVRLLDILPVLRRRNQDLMFSDLLNRIRSITPDEQTRLAALWRPTLKTDPVPASLSDLPALKAYAAGLLKTHLQQRYPQVTIDPDSVEVHVTQTTIFPSPAWQSQPAVNKVRRRSLSLTALALENIKGLRLGETVTFKAEISTPTGTTLHLSDTDVRAIIKDVDAPGHYKTLLEKKLLGPDQVALRTAWVEGERARMKLHAYVARLSGDFLDARDSSLEKGYRRIEHLLKHPSAQGRPPLDGYKVQVHYLMLGGTEQARNGVSIDEVLVISNDDPAGTLLLYTPQGPDGKAWRELADKSAIEALLLEPDWKNYCITRAARNEQWNPAQLFARQFPLVRYFPIEDDLFTTLYEARVRHLIASVEYFGASNQRVDRDTVWYWINASLRFAIEFILGVAALPLSLPVYLLRGLYGLANVNQALIQGRHEEATDALIQTLLDVAGILPFQAFKPLLRQIRPLPSGKVFRLVRTSRLSQDGSRQPLLAAEPSSATSLRSLAADLKDYEIKTPPELNYLSDGLFVDRTPRMDQYVKLEGKWYRTGSRAGKRYLLREHSWAEDIQLVRAGNVWQPLPVGRLRGGAPEALGTTRYEIAATHRGALEELIRTITRRLDRGWVTPNASAPERQAAAHFHQVSRRLTEDAQVFFAERPAPMPRTLATDLLDAGSSTQLLERGFQTGNGIVLGAPYHARAGRQLLIDNMRSLAMDHQVKTLYLENLLRDFDQVHLNDFHRTGVMSQRLRDTLRRQDAAQEIDPNGPHSLYEVVSNAQRHDIRVQALDCGTSFRESLGSYTPNRARALKYYGRQVINTDQLQQGPHRWIALVQDSHASTVLGEPGLADLLGTVNLRAVDVGGQPLPLRVLDDLGEFTQGRYAQDIQLVRADAKLEVNVAPQPLPRTPAPHRGLLIRPEDFLIEQKGDRYSVVCRSVDPHSARLLVPAEHPVIRSRLVDSSGDSREVFHVEAPRFGDIRGVKYRSIEDLIWGLQQARLRQVVELSDVTYLRQPRLDTHPQLSRAGMFTVEKAPQGPILINRSRDRSLATTIIRTDQATGKFYIVHQRWGFSEAQLFASIDDLSEALVRKVRLERVAEATDL
ncbi:membrane-targeted effector domain-containing toxin [Pseudomonas gingeri]|uniref:membrane-targeted effector domain-containing toxin n=1 Tax=Pseudomonas gingeri TaxID=117681 RepID=UPI0015A1E8FA|nr:membrane-targeted effector domain-containing toxin [Pseudomonas gingeri]NVZ99490.1 type III effector HopAC1 [Pseudomonas gingeri]NWA15488.1 type III effector HopAC1 [Pseudomonas gingeri]NWA56715.1 type III effector HopAC1 [Pseudomonas gingeri]NWA95209.1 type III effector HopAC1 [Pseudomonas gingeri]NWB05291.1 type III effector HopAC1 [Pseudomonas gingeri]